MLIVHVSQDFRPGKPQLGGYSRLRSIVADANDHIIFTLHYGDDRIHEEKVDRAQIVSIGVRAARLRWLNRWYLTREIGSKCAEWLKHRGFVPDVLFGHSQLPNFAILRVIRRKLGKRIPLLWEANGIWGSSLFDGSRDPAHLLGAAEQFLVFRRASHVIAQTERTKSVIVSAYHVSAAKISVVTNGFDTTGKPAKQYAEGNRPLLAGFVGLIDEMNGAPFLLGCIERAASFARFEFIGHGPDVPQVEALAKKGLVDYRGPIPHAQMMSHLLSFDLLVIPRLRSFGSENFIPTKLLEAMGLGLIVLGSNVGGISEVVINGQNGVLFKPGSQNDFLERLEDVARMPVEELRAIGSAARETVSANYGWPERHRLLAQIYNELVGSPRASIMIPA
jgi:glycosyltransferase involved in cell wall biosynthesis